MFLNNKLFLTIIFVSLSLTLFGQPLVADSSAVVGHNPIYVAQANVTGSSSLGSERFNVTFSNRSELMGISTFIASNMNLGDIIIGSAGGIYEVDGGTWPTMSVKLLNDPTNLPEPFFGSAAAPTGPVIVGRPIDPVGSIPIYPFLGSGLSSRNIALVDNFNKSQINSYMQNLGEVNDVTVGIGVPSGDPIDDPAIYQNSNNGDLYVWNEVDWVKVIDGNGTYFYVEIDGNVTEVNPLDTLFFNGSADTTTTVTTWLKSELEGSGSVDIDGIIGSSLTIDVDTMQIGTIEGFTYLEIGNADWFLGSDVGPSIKGDFSNIEIGDWDGYGSGSFIGVYDGIRDGQIALGDSGLEFHNNHVTIDNRGTRVNGDLSILDGLIVNGSSGTDGQVLMTTGSGVVWKDTTISDGNGIFDATNDQSFIPDGMEAYMTGSNSLTFQDVDNGYSTRFDTSGVLIVAPTTIVGQTVINAPLTVNDTTTIGGGLGVPNNMSVSGNMYLYGDIVDVFNSSGTDGQVLGKELGTLKWIDPVFKVDTVLITFSAVIGDTLSAGNTPGYWTAPKYLDGAQIIEVQYAFQTAHTGGTVDLQLTDSFVGYAGATIADGDRVEVSDISSSPITINEGDLVQPFRAGASYTSPPTGLIVNLTILK